MGVLSREPLDLQSLIAQVAAPERGGVATFLGLVRNHQDGRTVVDLEYSSYEPMAEAVCADIIAEAEQRWQVKLAIQHRLGRLEIGEAAVAVAAAGAHREEAFAACRYAIEELKRRVPIWKRERFADGTVEWVDPTARESGIGNRESGIGNYPKAESRIPNPESRIPYPQPRIPIPESRFPISDKLGRPLGSLRLSVTDRCNLRCGYCMPEESYVWLPRESLLTFEELDRLAGIFLGLGVSKLRLTGGEPLLRHELPVLVRMLAQRNPRDLALTTNGILLAQHAATLHAAGLKRVTVSLDTLRSERMLAFARSSRHRDVLAGIAEAQATGFEGIKLNSVIIRGFNEDEVLDLLEYARQHGLELRYIEYMDVGGATRWRQDDVVTRAELLELISDRYGRIEPLPAASSAAPAERFRLRDGTCFGIIASVSAPFCADCDRSRLTADGTWLSCLYAERGMDLREPLRSGVSDRDLAELITQAWRSRTDRGAEERLAMPERGVLYQVEGLRQDPRREMHTRGG